MSMTTGASDPTNAESDATPEGETSGMPEDDEGGGTEPDPTDPDPTDPDPSGGSSGEEGCGISHDLDIQPLWEAHCTAACHEAGGNWTSLLLTAADAYDAIVDEDGIQTGPFSEIKIVMPNDVANSYLIHKLRGTQAASVGASLGGVAMPAVETEPMVFESAPALSEDEIGLIEDWIDCGAPR